MSETSHESGHADDEPAAPRKGEPVAVELEPARERMGAWAFFGTILGAVMVWKLGTVAVWVGVVLIAIGLVRAFQLVRSFLVPAGAIEVSTDRVALPLGPYKRKKLVVKPAEVSAVYFLRRSIPWNHAAPVLVVEVGPRALLYPRDWFATEADQRRVVSALVPLLPESPAAI